MGSWRTARGLGLAAVGFLVTAALFAAPASATFPGRNGEILYQWGSGAGKDMFTTGGIAAIHPRTKSSRGIRSCYQEISLPEPGCVNDAPALSRARDAAYTLQSFRGHAAGIVERNWLEIASVAGGRPTEIPLAHPTFDVAWSPDGSRLLATRYGEPGGQPGSGPKRIVLIGRGGNELGTVTAAGGSPDWSAKGTIAYAHAGNVWVMRLGRPARQLTFKGGSSPSWAPEGRRLAFVRDGDVWTVRANGKRLKRLTERGGTMPAWSPDGRKIAFVRPHVRGGLHMTSLYVKRADGARPAVALIRGEDDYSGISNPAWATRSAP